MLQELGRLGGEHEGGKPQVDGDGWECYTETGLCLVSVPFTWSSLSFLDKGESSDETHSVNVISGNETCPSHY